MQLPCRPSFDGIVARVVALVVLALASGGVASRSAAADEAPSDDPIVFPGEAAAPDDAAPPPPRAPRDRFGGGRLPLTGGVSSIEGAAGGGIVPWALIAGNGTRDQVGGAAFASRLDTGDASLDAAGVALGFFDRVELSFARQRFDTRGVGAMLGLGRGFTFEQTVVGAKLRLAGDAVLDTDSPWPQLAIGVQRKRNGRADVLARIGARDDHGTDVYLAATKLLLGQGVLVSGTLRRTRANQGGLLGFGGDRHDDHRWQPEASIAWFVSRRLAIGVDYRAKPDNLRAAREDDWFDVFVAWAPSRHASLTVAYADLGDIAIADRQRGVYASLQVSF